MNRLLASCLFAFLVQAGCLVGDPASENQSTASEQPSLDEAYGSCLENCDSEIWYCLTFKACPNCNPNYNVQRCINEHQACTRGCCFCSGGSYCCPNPSGTYDCTPSGTCTGGDGGGGGGQCDDGWDCDTAEECDYDTGNCVPLGCA